MRLLIAAITFLFIMSCSDTSEEGLKFNGRLETTVVSLSAKTAGTADSVFFDEGDLVNNGQVLAVIEQDRLQLRAAQRKAVLDELEANKRNLAAQLKQVQSRLAFNEKMLAKTERLVSNGATTSQNLDELQTENTVLKAQISGLHSSREMIESKEAQAVTALKLAELDLKDSRLKASLKGMVLNRYIEQGELVNQGKVLFDLADLSEMEAVIYIPLNRLNKVKIGTKASVYIDGIEQPFEGSVKHIASESEFTPKTILTEETRTTLVYAVKVSVPNPDLKLKIGMPVDVVIEDEN